MRGEGDNKGTGKGRRVEGVGECSGGEGRVIIPLKLGVFLLLSDLIKKIISLIRLFLLS